VAAVSKEEYDAVLNSLTKEQQDAVANLSNQNILNSIKAGSGGASLSEVQNIAQNGLAVTQGPGSYNVYNDPTNLAQGLQGQQTGRAENISNWGNTTNFDELVDANNLDAARTWTMNQYGQGNITAEEAQELENQAFEQQYGSLEHTVQNNSAGGPGKDNVLSGESWVETTYTPTDYENLSQEAALNQGESHNVIEDEFVQVEGLGGQLFKQAVTGALTAGIGAGLAPSIAGLSAGAQGAINGGLNSAIGGVVSGNGLDIKDIGVGALTGGVGGSLSNADGMLGGFVDTGSNLADDAIKGAITGGIGGALEGDVLGGALTGGVSGAGMNLVEQGIGWAGDKINGFKEDLTGPGEFDFAMGENWDLDDQLTNDMNLDMLQEIVPGGEYIEIPDSVQDALDQQALDDYYSPPEQIQVGNQDIIDQMNENDLNAILDYEASDEFVGPGISGAADYDHTTPAGQILDNMTQEDVISESYLFDQYGREMDGTYTIGVIDGKTSIIETATGNYVTSEATAGNPFEVGDPRRSFYEQLSDFDKHLYMAGTLPSPGLSASPIDFLDDVPDVPEVEQIEEVEEVVQEQQEAAESDPINNTDTSLDSGEQGGGNKGTPSDSVDTAVGSIVAQLEDEQLQAVLSQNPNLAQQIADQIAEYLSQSTDTTETEESSDSAEAEETVNETESNTQEESASETEETEESETETGSTPTNEDPSPTENNATPGGSSASNIASLLASIQAAAAAATSSGAVDGGDTATGNPDGTPGGQNADENGGGGLEEGDDTGDGDDTGSGVQTGDGTGTGEEGEDGGDGEGDGDPGIGAGIGGMLAGLGAGAGSGGSSDRPIWSLLDAITRLPGYQKKSKAPKSSINEGLMQAAKNRRRT
jgi:hypothetical protein